MPFDRKDFNREVGFRLQLHRKRADMTQEDVASALEMPRSTYGNIERGRQRVPADVVWRVAILLDVPVEELLPKPVHEAEEESRGLEDLSSPWLAELSGSSDIRPLEASETDELFS